MNDARLHPYEYILVTFAVVVIAVVKSHVPFFEQLLVAVFYLLVIVVVALFGDYIAGFLAIVLSSLAVNYDMPPYGLKLDRVSDYRTMEVLVVGTIVCLLAWRSRRLENANHSLVAKAEELKKIVRSLQTDTRNKKKEMERLNIINKDLDQLVKQFLEDDDYWLRQKNIVKTHIKA